ncbi:MAG: helix-turn-helix domain-containing protein [Pseudomonadota bacterium]|nr:helix-turn-helix domain-containing protein [Pseudomonadota bacterium]
MHELDMTHAALARLSGVSGRTLNACLSGHSEISQRLLLRLAAALRLTLQLAPAEPATGSGDPCRAGHALQGAAERRHIG